MVFQAGKACTWDVARLSPKRKNTLTCGSLKIHSPEYSVTLSDSHATSLVHGSRKQPFGIPLLS
jgi:hypothetical protein